MPDGTTPAASAGISISALLLQAQRLLNDADEANHSGDYSTFALQRQACAVLAEAIDRLATDREPRPRGVPRRGRQPLAVHPYHETQE